MKRAYILLALFLFFPITLYSQCNELSVFKNPYLANFKKDKVCWKPWGEKALSLAKKRNKLIFLRVVKTGCENCVDYSRSIYQSKDIAYQLNKNFINILVDHTTKPDIANSYKNFIFRTNEKIDFPISTFLTPDRKAFIRVKNYNKEKFKSLIVKVTNTYAKNSRAIIDSANYSYSLSGGSSNFSNDFDVSSISKSAEDNLKFIKRISYLELLNISVVQKINFLLDFNYYQSRKKDNKGEGDSKNSIIRVVKEKLKELSYSKYYDHVEGGFFFKNSFGKSLNLNAELSILYTKLYRITGDSLYENVSREILDYILAYFSDGSGGFFNLIFPFDEKLNYDHHLFPSNMLANSLSGVELGALRKNFNLEKIGTKYKLSLKKDSGWDIKYDLNFFKIIQKLISYRREKGFPFRDVKKVVLSSARAIEALSYGYQTFGESRYLLTAKMAASYSYTNYFRNRQLHRYIIDKRVYEEAVLDDFTTLTSAFLSLYRSTSDLKWYALAVKLNNLQGNKFWDKEKYAYFYSKRESLPKFTKLFSSVDFIASNSFALANLYSLYNISATTKHLDKANKLVSYFQGRKGSEFLKYPKFLSAIYRNQNNLVKVVVIKGINELMYDSLKEIVFQGFYPDIELFGVYTFSDKVELRKINTLLKVTRGLTTKDGLTSAYVCTDSAGCGKPITSVKSLVHALNR